MSEAYKITELGEVPESWTVVRLGDFADVTKLAGFEFTEYMDYVEDGEVIALRALNVKNGKLDLSDVKKIKRIVSEGLTRSKLNIGDIVFTYVGTIGEVALIKESDKFHLAPNISKITVKNSVDTEFIVQYLRSPIIKSEINKHLTTTSQPALSMGNIRKMLFILPGLSEQRKIAEILSTLDEKIDVINDQITQATELKEGLMQRLLTKGIGHTSFKDSPLGEIPESWNVAKCDDVAEITSSKRIHQSDYLTTGIPFYRGKEISSKANGKKLEDLVFISEKLFNELADKFGAPVEGDILITAVGTIGVSYLVREGEKFYFKDGNLMWLRNISKGIDKTFLRYYLSSKLFQKMIDNVSSGSSQKALTIVKFKELYVALPPLEEQAKIAEILFTVDEKLDVLKVKKESFVEMKKGLMQQLLTGKIRVNQTNELHERTQPRRLLPVDEGKSESLPSIHHV